MDHISRVHEEESSEQLVNKILNMVFREILARVDYSVQIRFHKFSDDINIVVAGFVFRFEQVNHIDNILVFEEFCI